MSFLSLCPVLFLCVCEKLGFCFAQFILRPVFVKESALVPRVVNGTPAKIGEFPFQVAFREKLPYSKRRYFTYCGGSIIKPSKVLSAAHCFTTSSEFSSCYKSVTIPERKLRGHYIVAGTLKNTGNIKKKDGQWRSIKVVIYPTAYEFPFYDDIAIAITKVPFVFDENVNKIPYARYFKDYNYCVASGYGLISDDLEPEVSSKKLMKAPQDVVPNYWCNLRLRRDMSQLVCTGVVYSNIGKGDSGGPLVCYRTGQREEGKHGLLVGIASGTVIGEVSFFTRVSSFVNYIERNIARRKLITNLYSFRTVSILAYYRLYHTIFI